MHCFQHKGCVYVPMDNTEKKLTLDEAMDIAIETGAEEVEETSDNDGNRVLQVTSLRVSYLKLKLSHYPARHRC